MNTYYKSISEIWDAQNSSIELKGFSIKKEESEEALRKSLIIHLNKRLGYPRELIQKEFYLGNLNAGDKSRADIIIWSQEDPNKRKPLFLFELKKPGYSLGKSEYEQIKRYLASFKNHLPRYVVITNGTEGQIFQVRGKKYIPIKSIPHIRDLEKGNKIKRPSPKLFELTNSLTSPTNKINIEVLKFHQLRKYANLDLNSFIHRHYIQVFFYLMNRNIDFLKIQEKSQRTPLITIDEDFKVWPSKFGNPSGGLFDGYYRVFKLNNRDQISLSVTSYVTTNGTKKISLVGCFNDKLIVNIFDKNCVLEGERINFYHSGVISGGKIRLKREQLVLGLKNKRGHYFDLEKNKFRVLSIPLLKTLKTNDDILAYVIEPMLKFTKDLYNLKYNK